MEKPKNSMASILNNDDNPSFFIPSSRPAKSRSPVSSSRLPPHMLPASSTGSITRDFAAISPGGSTNFHHRDLLSSRPSPLTPSPEPPGYFTSHALPSRSAGSYSSSASTTASDRLSIRSITRPHGGQPEPLSPQSSRSSTGDPAGPKMSKKNKYPCPYAASHGCTATFTTSGHAARHGKKHTGEKSVHCPICNKAFTRKDNMKQHKRTHRSSGAAGGDDERRSSQTMTGGNSSSSKWDLSHSDTDNVPPTPTSDRPPSNRSDVDMMDLGADDVAAGRIPRGEGAKRPHSSPSRSAHRSRRSEQF